MHSVFAADLRDGMNMDAYESSGRQTSSFLCLSELFARLVELHEIGRVELFLGRAGLGCPTASYDGARRRCLVVTPSVGSLERCESQQIVGAFQDLH